MKLSSSNNLVDAVIDEIALEGLDGITLEALWDRLVLRFGEKEALSPKLKEQIWSICLQGRELAFYKLETPRDKLIIFNRYDFVDPDLGIILEPDDVPPDIYTHCPIDDVKNGVKGSCASYYTRKDISDEVKTLNIHEVQEIYGRSLAIVASQEVRQNALMDKNVCPILYLTVIQYCFLERVGRARYHGEVTQGKVSLSLLGEDPRSLFYHRKFLLRHKLLTKQLHHQKSGGHSCSGSLLHLPRFFVERKPKIIYLAQKVVEILKAKKSQVAEYSEIKKELGIENSIKKLFKTSCFQNVVKTDLIVPYRTLYPHADKTEWQRKNNSKEKMLRVVQLIDNNIDVNDLWSKDEVVEGDDDFDLDISAQKFCVPFLKQANSFVEASGQDGLGQSELAQKMGLPKLQSRTFFRNLAKSNIVAIYMNDMGRQRVTKYVSRKYEDSSRMSKQYNREVSKMRKLAAMPLESSTVEEEEEMKQKVELKKESPAPKEQAKIAEPVAEEEMKEPQEEKEIVEEKKEELEKAEEEKPEEKSVIDTASLNAATKILQRYKMPVRSGVYKRTFQNIAETKEDVMEVLRRSKRPRLALKEAEKEENAVNEEEEKMEVDNEADLKLGLEDKNKLGESSSSIDKKNGSYVTYRLLKRANIIIEAVKEHKVIDDMTKLMKMIQEEEEKEGYDVKIDKKSLLRLLQRLAKDDLVKNIKLILSTNSKAKSLTFICDPSIDVNHTVIRSAVEQAKLKFCLLGAQKVQTVLQSKNEKVDLGENSEEPNETEKLSDIDKESRKASTSNLVFDAKAGKRYGYSPKFIRMQTLHIFLFYLVYEHPGKPSESHEKVVDALRAKGLSIDENLEKEISTIYNTEIGWKMFVPPLPKHKGWPFGWALVCDMLLRMPLSIFLKIHKVSYNIPELENYRNHPIRKHLLVIDLPSSIRNILLIRRRYIFSVHDAVTRLCYIGLVQLGPQKLKEKDKVFVYVNRNTELLDTTTSAAHYHKIEEKIYSVMRFEFTSLRCVDKYWYKLWTTCINTRLGGRLVVQGKDIVLEDLNKKVKMIEATTARGPEEAPLLDNGQVPGDRMGAAGIDSAFFAHLKRNWNWDSTNYPFKKNCGQVARKTDIFEGERDAYLSKVKPKPLRFTEYHGLRKITGPVTVDADELKKSHANPSKAAQSSSKKLKKHAWTASGKVGGVACQRSYVRRVLPRRRQIRARVKYDEIDYSALQRMDKLRVDWDTREDNILLVCKVAMTYLCPNRRKQLITFTAVRDVLRSYSLTSHNKTSRACQRRLLYMLKKPQTAHSVTLGVEELKQDFNANRRFGDVVDRLKKEYTNCRLYDQQLTLVFRDLVAYIAKKNYRISDIQSASPNSTHSTVEEFALFHRIKYPSKVSTAQEFHERSTNDIHSATINSVIHSSMCCGKDRRSWAYQLFRIYQQYPEWLLRRAMAKIRADQMISVKKHYVFAMRKQMNACMPMSSSQYQLSSGYIQKFNTKLPYTVFKESYNFFYSLLEHYSKSEAQKSGEELGIEAVPVNGGTIAAIHDYINMQGLEFDVEIPRQIIMLDPELSKDDERYIRIARRYQDILRNIEKFHVDEILEEVEVCEKREEKEEVGVEKKVEKVEEDKERSLIKREEKSRRDEKVEKKNQEVELQGNTDTEACETDHEVNFEEEDDEEVREEEEDTEDEDDDTICFLDGTRIKIGKEDIEKSGLKRDEDVEDDFYKLTSFRHGEKSRIEEIRVNGEKNEEQRCGLEEISRNESERERETDSNQSVEALEAEEDNAKRDSALRVNEMIERVKSLRNTRELYYKATESNDWNKRCTRIALLKMREELNDLTPNDSHHAHEHFVLNMFKIFFNLRRSQVEDSTDLSVVKQLSIPTELLPLKNETHDRLLDELRKNALFPKNRVSYTRFKRELECDEAFKRGLDAVYEFVREKREVGADLEQLMVKFYTILGPSLYEILSVLREGRLVLRSGVKNTRYVHQKYADPWLIHSYKIMRLQKEGLQIIPGGSLYVVSEEKSKETEINETEVADKKESSESPGDDPPADQEVEEGEGKKNQAESENPSSSQRKMQKSRTCLLQTKDIYRAAKQLDLDTAEEIRVVVRPWIRVDGALNRRVLDRMLGGILAYCLIHPGLHLTKIQEKFAPAIQPFHTKELVEMLVKLECLKIGVARKRKITLFSKSISEKPMFSEMTDGIARSEEELIVEPVFNATLKFSVFLSKRMYTTDFLAE